ncbi:uncharacterized protein N7515_007823 [Penicillium bovifimosum]|uniref:DUF3669 domain-containing protein n=1 Tax=Penicillium bovifimosum TaxID=126998 RepID=A0A9W9KX92_9EURO|nr:uncharacterized protein N7515_007823 [Penicillium bovifimosum]KAJ5123998.1 hypothetical protein N7515_007823 [Penicillium bovifimosum]
MLAALAAAAAPTEDEDILRQTLSVRSIISTSSSWAEPIDPAVRRQDNALVVIGRGTCGTVFEIPETDSAYKKGSQKRSLWTDANLTNTACRAVKENKTRLQEIFPTATIPRVPLVTGWLSENELENWWRQNLPRFPADTQPGYLFQVQRIWPLPRPAREALIRLYFPRKMRRLAYNHPANKACLVRPYLGLRREQRLLPSMPFSLQNFPLYLDQVEELRLDAVQLSEEMAIGLAIIHWEACLDGMDMEFVLGRATTDGELPTVVENFGAVEPFSVPAGDTKGRQVHLWMLDFDKAYQLPLKESWKDSWRESWRESWKRSCDMMVTAVTANDPYFPNPAATGSLEHKLWDTFKRAYLLASSTIIHTQKGLPENADEYPALFLEAWRNRATELAKDTEGVYVKFG